MINKYLVVSFLCIAFVLGAAEGYYVHDGLNEATINVKANKILSDNFNMSLNRSNINFSSAKTLCYKGGKQ